MRKVITDIGNKKIEVIIGENDRPTVVILPGMSSSIDEWEIVTNQLDKLTNFIVFQRSGTGNSELGRETRTTLATVNDLKLLLDKQNVNNPIILVGHSYGGLCVQHYAKTYPNKVSGVVLIDSTSVDLHILNEIQLTNDEDSDARWIEKYIQYSMMSSEQLEREIIPQIDQNQKKLSLVAQKEIIKFQTNPNLYRTVASEIQSWENCAKKIKQAGNFPDIPLIVIGRDPDYTINFTIKEENVSRADAFAIENVWQKLIQEQTMLSRQNEFILAKGSGHSVHLERPDLIIDAILSLLD